MAGEPNELPEGGDGGGGFSWGGPHPGWAELPAAIRNRIGDAVLVREVLRLRNRLHQLETTQFLGAFSGRAAFGGGVGGPNELPEGGDGGGGGVIHWPGHWPGENPAELPVEQLVGVLEERFAVIETQLGALQEQLSALRNQG